MSLYQSLVIFHIVAGLAALLSFWVAAAQRKGTHSHRTSGKAYLLSMTAVIATGIPLAVTAFASAHYTRGLFLTFLLTITGSACWRLWRAIRDKQAFAAFAGLAFRALAATNFVLGVIVAVLGWRLQSTPMMIVGVGGVVFGVLDYRLVTVRVRTARWWLRQHIAGVMGAGFATHVTFMSLGLSRLMPQNADTATAVAWTLALAGASIATVLVLRKYGVIASQRVARNTAAVSPSPAKSP